MADRSLACAALSMFVCSPRPVCTMNCSGRPTGRRGTGVTQSGVSYLTSWIVHPFSNPRSCNHGARDYHFTLVFYSINGSFVDTDVIIVLFRNPQRRPFCLARSLSVGGSRRLPAVPFLTVRDDFHPKRNRFGKKLVIFPASRASRASPERSPTSCLDDTRNSRNGCVRSSRCTPPLHYVQPSGWYSRQIPRRAYTAGAVKHIGAPPGTTTQQV